MELVKGQLGADVVVDYTKEEYLPIVMRETGGDGVRVVFDAVGKDTFDQSLACVARKGSMVSYGNSSGPVTGFAVG